jgi:hypothetical protein
MYAKPLKLILIEADSIVNRLSSFGLELISSTVASRANKYPYPYIFNKMLQSEQVFSLQRLKNIGKALLSSLFQVKKGAEVNNIILI